MRFTDDDIVAEIERAIERAGSLRRFAKEAGVSPTFVSLVRRSKSPPGETLARHLGFVDDGKRWVRERELSRREREKKEG